jgi:hypothetical protein
MNLTSILTKGPYGGKVSIGMLEFSERLSVDKFEFIQNSRIRLQEVQLLMPVLSRDKSQEVQEFISISTREGYNHRNLSVDVCIHHSQDSKRFIIEACPVYPPISYFSSWLVKDRNAQNNNLLVK